MDVHGDEDVDITSDVVEWGWGIRGDLVDESILLELCVSSLRRGHANLTMEQQPTPPAVVCGGRPHGAV